MGCTFSRMIALEPPKQVLSGPRDQHVAYDWASKTAGPSSHMLWYWAQERPIENGRRPEEAVLIAAVRLLLFFKLVAQKEFLSFLHWQQSPMLGSPICLSQFYDDSQQWFWGSVSVRTLCLTGKVKVTRNLHVTRWASIPIQDIAAHTFSQVPEGLKLDMNHLRRDPIISVIMV